MEATIKVYILGAIIVLGIICYAITPLLGWRI